MKNKLHNYLIKALKFPSEIQLESSSLCNAKCVMCPRDIINRKAYMDRSLFFKIIKEIGDNDVEFLHFHLNGEPLLMDIDELVFRINYARERCVNIKNIIFFTNGSLLTKDRIDKLLDSSLNFIKISINGGDKESYENTMIGLKWKTLLKNIAYLRKRKLELNSKLWIETSFIPMKTNFFALEKYYKIFKKEGIDEVGGGGIINIGGHIDADSLKVDTQYTKGNIKSPCERIFIYLTVMTDGMACICSQDVAGEHIIGDCNNETIKEVWQGKAMSKARESFAFGDKHQIPYCKDCDYPKGCVTPDFWNLSCSDWGIEYKIAMAEAYKK